MVIIMKKLTESELQFIILRVLENAREEASDDDVSDFSKGKRLAYYEVLDTVKNELEAHDVDVSEYGLDATLETLL